MTRGRDRNDDRTGDLLSWEPPEVVKRYDERRVKTATMRARIAHAVSETLSESRLNRDAIASKMSEFLGEEVSKNMLDAYASEAREDHTISYVRLLALIHVTNDVRPLQVGAEMFSHLVVDDKYMKFIELGMQVERREHIQRADEDVEKRINLLIKDVRSGWPS